VLNDPSAIALCAMSKRIVLQRLVSDFGCGFASA
jgi:hypothetical protein